MNLLFMGQLLSVLAQLEDPGIDTPEEAALIFSGPQFFIALLSGLVLAFGFQLLLTNLSVAAGISYVGHSSSSSSSSSKSSSGSGIGKISVAVGIWTLITVSLALFFACWLAVKLSLYNSALLGAITGLVIWGTYFSLLFWVSSTTVGSLIGSVVRTATSSFNSLVGTATAAFGAKAASNQVYETAEAVAAAVRKEVVQGIDNTNLLDSVQDYVVTLRSPQLETESLEAEFERLIKTSNLSSTATPEILDQVDQAAFEKLVSRRTDLSREEARRVAKRLHRIWQRELSGSSGRQPLAELVEYVQSARPGDKIADRLSDRLDQFLDEYRKQGQSQQQTPGIVSQGFNALMGAVMGSTDLSELDVETVTNKVKQVKNQLVDQGSSVAQQLGSDEERYSVVKADVESYLLNTYPWQMKPERLRTEFREVLYDANADTGLLRQELDRLNRDYFETLLSDRGLLTPSEIERTSNVLEAVRVQVLKEVIDIDRFEQAKALKSQVEVFLRTTPKAELMSDMGKQAFHALVEDDDASFDDLQVRFSELTYDFFARHLRTRNDLNEGEIQLLAAQFEQIKNETLQNAHNLQDRAKMRAQEQWQSVQDHLRNTGKPELNPEGIKRDLKILLNEPDVGVQRLRQRFSQFDRETLIRLLGQREDLSETEVRRIARDVESNYQQVVNAPGKLSAQAQAKYDEATSAISDYLRRTGKPELNPEGIQRDINLLLNDPKAGTRAMRARLAAMDRDTLVQLLSQRDDLSEEEVNQIIDDILETIRSILKSPQRLARRAKAQVMSFEQSLEDYLRNTDKAELHPEGIKRDLQILMNDPRAGGRRIQQRLAQMDRSTAVALLAQRPDMTQQEAEAAVDQVFAVRDEILAQIRNVQEQVKGMIRSVLARIQAYLDSLDRPELNYDGIRRDLRTLFDDPQSGLEALKQRFSQFDRDTLIAVMSSHDSISETDAHRIIGQVESARDSAIRKAERLEQEVENRVQALKHQAQQQVEDTRKAAEAAAWWIFSTAAVSAIVSAIGGSLAVLG
ncbi:MFS transporter [Oscillatoria sp. CS-180]|uniref:MFS transporter n=1 Tax=Oscillatoria sp. CS-180 TaxID=3021720 RepID=UPI00232C8CAD|nr:MFS transporter [Oscillatoria sp. CS-180]MDB9526054.1 MFS transporter [Oscillatoria sp. CS-180]